MRIHRILKLLAFGAIAVSHVGCAVWPVMTETDGYRPLEMGKSDQIWYWYAPQPVDLATDFGKSVQMARQSQTINPDASKNLEPVTILDGQAAIKTMDRYRGLFEKPPYTPKGSGESKQ